MIKKLTIKNFKAIKDLTIEFTPFTVLIGENSSGKSTVLQALDLLCAITTRDIDEYLKDREWEFSEIKSQFAKPDESIRFITIIDVGGLELVWDIEINNVNGRWLIKECIIDEFTDGYLSYKREDVFVKESIHDYSNLYLKSSSLKMIDIPVSITDMEREGNLLYKIKIFITSFHSFELLSPDKMRNVGSRGKVSNIGMSGEKLATYIHGLPLYAINKLNKTISELVGYKVTITTNTKDDTGQVEMYMGEPWKKDEIKTKNRYISDGVLRIIAFSAILISQVTEDGNPLPVPEHEDTKGLIMLDEIEDGINPALAETLMMRFKSFAKETKHQVIITSHSPVMLNFVDESDIQFMWRDDKGMIHAKPLFQTREMKETLEFLGPGEVWLNYPKESIIDKISNAQEDNDD